MKLPFPRPVAPLSLASSLLLCGWLHGLSAATTRITVAAGDWDRSQSVVTFQVPAGAARAPQLRDARGRNVPVQIDSSGEASFILDRLAEGQTASFELVESEAKLSGPGSGVEIARADRKLKVSVAGKPVLEYQAEPSDLPARGIQSNFQRGAYIHPILSPSGRLVTDDYPRDHRHHHGIWFPWTRTEFEGRAPDFWNMGQNSGRVEFAALDAFWSGPVHGGFVARHSHVDLTTGVPKTALNEVWNVRIYAIHAAPEPYWMFDLVSTQQCATASPLKLPAYHYGGLGFRGHRDWVGKPQQPFLTSEGISDKLKGNGTRGRWCHVGGGVDGQPAGVAVLGHPDNFRAPQPMRLNPDYPFLCFAPSQLGEWTIEPGRPYVSRYRFIVADGPPDAAALDRLWNDYAHPIAVKVETPRR